METKFEHPHVVGASSELLLPLKHGSPVMLRVTDPKIKLKKRIGKPVLFITPTEIYGLKNDALVFALQGQGCEVMKKASMKAAYLVRMGLSLTAAKTLIRELNLVFDRED